MSRNLVQIYVEQVPNSGIYKLLNLMDEENIFLNFKYKDSKDIAKAFSTFSQTFSIPADDNNKLALNFEFDTNLNIARPDYINTKIYINDNLFKVGLSKVSLGKYKGLQLSTYQIDFFTSLLSLKDVVGESTLASLTASTINMVWNDTTILSGLTHSGDIIIPLISTNRLLTYNTSASDESDIMFVDSTTKFPKALHKDELRPAIYFSAVMNTIISQFNLNIECPLFTRPEYTKLRIWCNKDLSVSTKIEAPITSAFGAITGTITDPYYDIFGDLDTNTYTIIATGDITDTSYFQFSFNPFKGIGVTGDVDIKLECIALDGTILASSEDTIHNDNETVSITFDLADLGITFFNPLEFKVYVTSSKAIIWANADVFLVGNGIVGGYLKRSLDNYSYSNLMQVIPDMKIIDFLSSFFKMFNLSALEDNESRKLIWLTPEDYSNTGLLIDYTEFGAVEDITVKKQDKFGKYVFQHTDPEYSSSVDFKTANVSNPNEKEFGQLIYDTNNPYNKNEYKLETNFSIMVPRMIAGTNVETYYGFDKTIPTLTAENGSNYWLYTPNTQDITIFYANGIRGTTNDVPFINPISGFRVFLPISLGYYSKTSNITTAFDDYNECKLINGTVSTYTNSLAFNVEVEQDPSRFIYPFLGDTPATPWTYTKNLYSNYYSETISDLINPRIFLYNWKVILPSIEMNRFSLTNTVIIGNTSYKILDAQLNLINGVCNMTLQNII